MDFSQRSSTNRLTKSRLQESDRQSKFRSESLPVKAPCEGPPQYMSFFLRWAIFSTERVAGASESSVQSSQNPEIQNQESFQRTDDADFNIRNSNCAKSLQDESDSPANTRFWGRWHHHFPIPCCVTTLDQVFGQASEPGGAIHCHGVSGTSLLSTPAHHHCGRSLPTTAGEVLPAWVMITMPTIPPLGICYG